MTEVSINNLNNAVSDHSVFLKQSNQVITTCHRQRGVRTYGAASSGARMHVQEGQRGGYVEEGQGGGDPEVPQCSYSESTRPREKLVSHPLPTPFPTPASLLPSPFSDLNQGNFTFLVLQ